MLVRRSRFRVLIATALLGAVGSATYVAAAQPVAMAGRWFDRRGIGTAIPIARGGIPAGPTPFQPNLPDFYNTLMTNGMGLFLTRSVDNPTPGVALGAAIYKLPQGMFARGAGAGGPLSKTVMQDGTSMGILGKPPSKLTIAGRFWDIPAIPFLIPIPAAPLVVDLFTTFNRGMPVASAATSMGNYPGVTAMIVMGPKASRPANFTFCPNPGPIMASSATALSCATPVPSPVGSGSQPGLVRYKAGTNQFGGVMNTVVTGGGYLHVIPASGLVTVPDPRIGHTGETWMLAAKRPLGGNQAGPWGGPRQKQNIVDEDPAPIFAHVAETAFGVITPMEDFGQFDLDPGPGQNFAPTSMNNWGITPLGQLSKNWGFPVTTGTVTVSFDTASVSGPPDIIIIRGSDMRTQQGKGTLTLVSGGMTNSIVQAGSNQNFSQGAHIAMILPEPQALAGAAGGLLSLLGAHFAIRRRRSRS
jgi:hypothetical protein